MIEEPCLSDADEVCPFFFIQGRITRTSVTGRGRGFAVECRKLAKP